MIIDAVSDLHGHYPKLEGGDLLIVAGDLTATHTQKEFWEFIEWGDTLPYRKRIFIAGNHDTFILPKNSAIFDQTWLYLQDSGTEFESLKIWGSPWTLTFDGINPKCTAFTGTESDLKARFDMIPGDTDILITHGPPYGVRDRVNRDCMRGSKFDCVGSKELMETVHLRLNLSLHVFGHIHEGYGQETSGFYMGDELRRCQHVNCSHVNERYEPVNKPIRIIL